MLTPGTWDLDSPWLIPFSPSHPDVIRDSPGNLPAEKAQGESHIQLCVATTWLWWVTHAWTLCWLSDSLVTTSCGSDAQRKAETQEERQNITLKARDAHSSRMSPENKILLLFQGATDSPHSWGLFLLPVEERRLRLHLSPQQLFL